MTILTTRNLGKYFGGQDIFSGLNLSLHHGQRVALVGANGAGKTTLLRILAGRELPTAGQIHQAKTVKFGYLEQHPSLTSAHGEGTVWGLALGVFAELRRQEAHLQALEAALAHQNNAPALLKEYGEAQAHFEQAGGYLYEQTIAQVLSGLGFGPADYQTPLTHLSGGQQSRAQLARLLLEQPDLLLLDEPTNHLDLTAIEWLENYLQSWPGALIVVAHDRYFLDKIATHIWEMSGGTIESYRGNFSAYSAQRAERHEHRLKEYEAQQKFIAQEEEFIRRNLAGQRTKEAQGRRKRLERLPRLERPTEAKTLHLPLQTTLRSGDLVLATHGLTVGYAVPLFTCPDLEIRRGDRIALLGPNGSGKTTLIKSILGEVKPMAGAIRLGAGVEIGYFAQTHATLNLGATILDEILAVENLPIAEARNYLGRFLFGGEDVFKPVGALSGGERSRVALAKLTLAGANFLILDEPTNHLDIPSQEILEQVLCSFEGTILLVSHDRYFVNALAEVVWAIESATRTVTVIAPATRATGGAYDQYLAGGQWPAPTPEAEKPPPASQLGREQVKAEKRATQKLVKQVETAEREIAAAEAELAQLAQQVEIAGQTQNVAQLQQLGRAYQAAEAHLDELLTRYYEAVHELEENSANRLG
jgi:ATP-binding cassette subfamily F protein 3